jgi:nitroreductase
MDIDLAIRSRRTCKVYTGDPVPAALVEELVSLAVWAPNHRLTQPWGFQAAIGPAVARLTAFVQQPPVSGAVEARKLPAIAERLARCGAVIQVTCRRSADAATESEDLAATCAAVQNLLLGATGRGLGTFWSTSPLLAHPDVQRWFGADPQAERLVGTIWLGWPADMPLAPQRKPVAQVLRWVSGPR